MKLSSKLLKAAYPAKVLPTTTSTIPMPMISATSQGIEVIPPFATANHASVPTIATIPTGRTSAAPSGLNAKARPTISTPNASKNSGIWCATK